MHFCTNCGAQIDDSANFCPSCNAPQQNAQSSQQPPYQQAPPQQPPYQQPPYQQPPYQQAPPAAAPNDFSQKFEQLNDTPDTTAEFDPNDIQSNKVMAVLAYLSWLVLIPIFAAKQSPFARFHVNQGLVLAIVEIAWGIFYNIIHAIGIFTGVFSIVNWLLGIVFFIFSILGIINAAKGVAKELPIIGSIKIFK